MDGISNVTRNEILFSTYNGENRNTPTNYQLGIRSENSSTDYSSLKHKEEQNGIHQTHQDPFVGSVISLHSVQQALQEEVRQLGEMGSSNVEGDGLDTQVLNLNEKGRALESQLEDVSSMLSSKESWVFELEGALKKNMLMKKESVFLLEICRDMEIELEALFKHRIEAEVEYLAVARTSQMLSSFVLKDRISLFEEQKSLAGQQSQMLHKLIDAERKAFLLKKKAEGLKASFEELLDTEENLKLQNKVYQHTLWFFIQLMLLLLAFIIPQFFPYRSEVVPT